MATASHSFKCVLTILASIGLFCPATGTVFRAQIPGTDQGTVLRVGVEEVRLDAVVLDAKGRQITGLTADDFKIYQDEQPQKVVSAAYISDRPAIAATVSAEYPAPPPSVARRTIVFLIDDLSMSFQDLHFARMSLRKFVENQMQPGDFVAILQASKGNSGLQAFTPDRQRLLDRIDAIGWSLNLHPAGTSQVAAIAYGIAALRDVPGRKFLFLVSARIMLPEKADADAVFNRLADEALRAGVVIHTLDILGGINNQVLIGTDIYKNRKESVIDAEVRPLYGSASPDPNALPSPGEIEQAKSQDRIDAAFGPRQAEIASVQARERISNREASLSQKTGGLFLSGSNFFLNGIGAAEEAMKGYYLLSYIPPENTFDPRNRTSYRRVRIQVNRPGCTVRTRDGFYGLPDAPRERARDPLAEAIFAPFLHDELKLQMAAGYVDAAEPGYLLRAWMHLDGRRIGILTAKDGGRSVSLEAVAATTDAFGAVQDSGTTKMEFRVSDRDIQLIRENGIRFFLSLVSKNPGALYVRVAVKDLASGAIGSAYQFMDIPDPEASGMSLSSIFLLNREEDASWIQSGMAQESQGRPGSSQRSMRRSQALRTFLPGESFDYAAVIYSPMAARVPAPELELQYTLYGNGDEVLKGEPESVDIRGIRDFSKIPVRKRLKLPNMLPPGDYVLHLKVRDRRAGGSTFAVQTLDFRIAGRSSVTDGSQTPIAIRIPRDSRTVVDMSAGELRRYDPGMSDLEPAQGQEELGSILEKAGERVIAFFRDFPNTSSKEQVRMQRYVSESLASRRNRGQPELLNPAGTGYEAAPLVDPRGAEFCKLLNCVPGDLRRQCVQLGCGKIETPEIHRTGPATKLLQEYSAEFNFFILPGSKSKGTAWEEDRADEDGRSVNPRDLSGFIASSGHTLHCMYLHPDHQANSKFRYLGREKKKPYAHVIAFAQKPESGDYLARFSELTSASPTRFLLQGVLWIDPDSYQILRMRTSMLAPEMPTALRETVTDITYGKVQFESTGREFWLPREVNVSWEFASTDKLDLVYRNQHKYSDYRLFSVDSDYKINLPGDGE